MIRVDIFRDNAAAIIGFQVSGHAGHAPRGEDIVCAGISALTQAAVLGLQRHLGRNLDLVVKGGHLEMRLEGLPDAGTAAILETMLIGLREIADLYRKSVQIREHRG